MKKNYSLLIVAAVIFSGHSIAQQINQENSIIISKDNADGFDEVQLREKMKADGLSVQVINTLIEKRRKLFQRGKNVDWKRVSRNQAPVTNAICTDMGAENGWGAWVGDVGTVSSGHIQTWTPPASIPVVPNFTITSGAAIDNNTPGPNVGDPTIPVVCPNFGNNSIELGEMCLAGCVAEQLTYPFYVTVSDTDFTFSYAIVLEDAGHAWTDQPYFEIMLLAPNGDTVLGSYFIYVGAPSIPGFYGVSGTGCGYAGTDQYKPWTMRGLHLAQYIGQTLTMVVTNVDCAQCGHWAYSYVDFDCDGILYSPRYCPGSSVVINSRSEPNSKYMWENGDTTEATTISSPVAGDTISCIVTPWAGYSFKANYVLTPAQANFYSSVSTNTVTLTNNSAGSVSCFWDFGDGNTSVNCNPSHVYSSVGTYTVCLTVQTDGCSSGVTSCSTVTILSTGINEYASSNDVKLVPNPASDIVFLEFKNGFANEKVYITVFNLIGAEVLKSQIVNDKGKYGLTISTLPSGTYFVKIKSAAGEITKKMIVSKE
ncbi:MAG: T9SS type A sorting domain-containing protein [Bacteroidetes bacterium]|nr:T9SS type A sorting domain-containing protein [Bacteroidota bacterium]